MTDRDVFFVFLIVCGAVLLASLLIGLVEGIYLGIRDAWRFHKQQRRQLRDLT